MPTPVGALAGRREPKREIGEPSRKGSFLLLQPSGPSASTIRGMRRHSVTSLPQDRLVWTKLSSLIQSSSVPVNFWSLIIFPSHSENLPDSFRSHRFRTPRGTYPGLKKLSVGSASRSLVQGYQAFRL